MKTILEQLDEAEKAATAGPWGPCLGSGNIECTAISSDDYGVICDLLPDYVLDIAPNRDISANMELITLMRNNIRNLLDVANDAARMQNEIHRLRGLLSHSQQLYGWNDSEALAKLRGET